MIDLPEVSNPCLKPGPGYLCKRRADHTGPCAVVPAPLVPAFDDLFPDHVDNWRMRHALDSIPPVPGEPEPEAPSHPERLIVMIFVACAVFGLLVGALIAWAVARP